MKPRVFVDDLSQLRLTFAKEFETQAAEVIARREKFIIALPGGSVASAFFPTLATLAVDWTRIEMFWIDERAVPPDHPDSNVALASRLLLVPARVPPRASIACTASCPTSIRPPGARPTSSNRSPAIRLTSISRSSAWATMGMSRRYFRVGQALVPTRPPTRAAKADQPVIAVYDSPKPPARRLTLTLSGPRQRRPRHRRRIRRIES